jgi:WXXGXW repeat (2 copies)
MKSTLQPAVERPVGDRAGRLERALKHPATVLPALAAVLLLGSVTPASAAIGIEVEIAPPAPPAVVVPPPRLGFVWAPGYWQWDGHHHVWVEGRWLRARPGFRWVPEHWVERRGHYHFVSGHWARG